ADHPNHASAASPSWLVQSCSQWRHTGSIQVGRERSRDRPAAQEAVANPAQGQPSIPGCPDTNQRHECCGTEASRPGQWQDDRRLEELCYPQRIGERSLAAGREHCGCVRSFTRPGRIDLLPGDRGGGICSAAHGIHCPGTRQKLSHGQASRQWQRPECGGPGDLARHAR
ncbi:Uncharacterized protein APZ42_002150, partial [Daphnia magna]